MLLAIRGLALVLGKEGCNFLSWCKENRAEGQGKDEVKEKDDRWYISSHDFSSSKVGYFLGAYICPQNLRDQHKL